MNSDEAKAWSSGVLPGNASGKELAIRKKGDQAEGFNRPHARGLSLCLDQPVLLGLGYVQD
tara:strand:+ start:336 stop:518 length:183 start_codon:yes stop_codon:yes gene_type:complete